MESQHGSSGRLTERRKADISRSSTDTQRVGWATTFVRMTEDNVGVVVAETETRDTVRIEDFYAADALMCTLSLRGPSYIIFNGADGDGYVQFAGSHEQLTVEQRTTGAGDGFRHLVWGRGPLDEEAARVPTRDGWVDVDVSQVLQLHDARVLLRAWWEGQPMPPGYVPTDITALLN